MVRTIMNDIKDNTPFGIFLVIVLFILGSIVYYREDTKNLSYDMLTSLSEHGTVVLKVDSSKNIIDVFGDTQSVFGSSHEQLKGKPISILIPSSLQESHSGYLDQVFKSNDAAIISIINPIKNNQTEESADYNIKCYYADGHAWCIIDPLTKMRRS